MDSISETYMYGGTDETNKGQCLLDLVIGFVYTNTNPKLIPYFGESKDYKKITKNYQEKLYEYLKKYDIYYQIVRVDLEVLSRHDSNINQILLHEQSKFALRKNIKTYYVDSHYKPQKLKKDHELLNKNCKFIVETSLDSSNVLVGLASILSKIEKLKMYEEFEKTHKVCIGSGNLNDKKTIKYIKENLPNVKGLRTKWSLKSLKS